MATNKTLIMVVVVFIFITGGGLFSQGRLEDYQRAEKFLEKNLKKIIYRLRLSPHWINDGSTFWYKVNTRKGKEFIIIDPVNKSKKPAFNHQKMAQALSKMLNKDYKPYALPFEEFEFDRKKKNITFTVKTIKLQCHLKNYNCKKLDQTIKDYSSSTSPDGKWVVFVKDYNLYIRSTITKKETQLTFDGNEKLFYAFYFNWYFYMNEINPSKSYKRRNIRIKWSSDSSKFVTHRVDCRKAKKLFLYQSMPNSGLRAEIWSYYRMLPGEEDGILIKYFICNVSDKKLISLDIRPLYHMENLSFPKWFKNSYKLNFFHFTRGLKKFLLYEIDGGTGKSRLVLEESSKTYIDRYKKFIRIIDNGKEVVMSSERDGWNHLYLFDWITGKLKNQITIGEFVVRDLVYLDEKKRQVYFLASGCESGEDPYFEHLYRVNLDGSGFTLLTPEHATHGVEFSPDRKYMVDEFSRVDLPPKYVLRRMKDGKILLNLEQADIGDLLTMGWKPPEPFKVKARDGDTDIYGAIFRPSNFDPDKKYPIIDSTYTGPHAVMTPKTFPGGCLNLEQPLAELGFIVITVDGLGTANRSKAFHNFSYQNLGDIGAPDHIKAMKELAKKYSYIDISRVGIFGWSAGGYDTVRALLTYPDFYKVGVAKSGNHDHRMAKAWWPEQYMGYPVGKYYEEQSNLNLAENLKGKLLMMHGDLDNNVNPAETLRMAGELIKADKDFEMLIIPNQGHDIRFHPYVLRKEWDFFVKHLLGVTPPEYKIESLAQ